MSEFHHSQAKAFIDIGGYQIPVCYQDAMTEFHAAQKAALMDRSFIGKVRVSGKDRETLLHRLTTNEMRHLPVGAGVVNIFTNAKGRVVDVVEMFMEAESIFLLTSPGRAPIVKQWIEKYTFIEEVRCEDLTAQFGVISLLGEDSVALLRKVFDWDVGDLPVQHTRTFEVEGRRVLVQRSGLVTPEQFNLLMAAEDLEKFWQLLSAQATPAGHAAYEMLRIHRGLPVMEKEITDEYNPHEVGLLPFINFEKGCYIGQEVIARLDSYQKVQRQLAGVELDINDPDDKLFAATPAPIYVGEQLAGQLTSACFSPELGKAIGLAVMRKQLMTPAGALEVRWPEAVVKGHLQTLPLKLPK